jgi:DNA helicase II / ATP-dependent DNA helicase PcrA
VTQVLQARKRLINAGKCGWSLAILVPTKRMTRFVSDILREPFGEIAAVAHTAAVDMEGPILAAEIVAFLLQQGSDPDNFDQFVDLLCSYFHGRGGNAPTKGDMDEATRFRAALTKWKECEAAGRQAPGNSVLNASYAVYRRAIALALTGDPDKDWIVVRSVLQDGGCSRLQEVSRPGNFTAGLS